MSERRKGKPRTDRERFMKHFSLSDEQMDWLLKVFGEEIYKLLPERGSGLSSSRLTDNRGEIKMSLLAQGGYTKEEREKLEKEIEEREKKYGYKRGSNASLTKPKKYEDIPESQFADPVGYNYPIDTYEHARAALTYWHNKRNRRFYDDPKARLFITERIVRACLKFGIEVTWDPTDPEYQKLPEELKKKMKGYGESKKSMLEDWQSFRSWQEAYFRAHGIQIPVVG